MLLEAYQLLELIEAGINHPCFVNIFSDKVGFNIRIEYKDSRDNEYYYFQQIFTHEEIRAKNLDDEAMIKYFVDEVNENIRASYAI